MRPHLTMSLFRTTTSRSGSIPISHAAMGLTHPRTSSRASTPCCAYGAINDRPTLVSPDPGRPERPATCPGPRKNISSTSRIRLSKSTGNLFSRCRLATTTGVLFVLIHQRDALRRTLIIIEHMFDYNIGVAPAPNGKGNESGTDPHCRTAPTRFSVRTQSTNKRSVISCQSPR